jgi:hypothetical protein
MIECAFDGFEARERKNSRLGLKYVATDRHWPSLAVKIWEVGSAPRGQARTRYFKFCELLEAHQTAKMLTVSSSMVILQSK